MNAPLAAPNPPWFLKAPWVLSQTPVGLQRKTAGMKNLTLSALLAFASLGSVAGAVTVTATTTTTTQTASMTRAQMHTQNNLTRYSRATMRNMSRYSRAECTKHRGVMIKQKSNGQLVCVAKLK